MGEIYAAQALGLRLETASSAGFDAMDKEGRRVEIKTTTCSSIALSASGTLAERLIVALLDPEMGAARIIYDGEAAVAWSSVFPKHSDRAVVSM